MGLLLREGPQEQCQPVAIVFFRVEYLEYLIPTTTEAASMDQYI